MDNSSKISNMEWGLVITATAVIDVLQAYLDLFVIGIILNRFIDIAVGMVLFIYFPMRGVKMGPKQILTTLSAFGLEIVGPGDALPLWTLDVILIMIWEKAEGKVEKAAPIVKTAIDLANKKGLLRGEDGKPMLKAEIREGSKYDKMLKEREKRQELAGSPNVSSPQTTDYNEASTPDTITASSSPDSTTINISGQNQNNSISTPQSEHVVDLRRNPRHERTEGRRGVREIA